MNAQIEATLDKIEDLKYQLERGVLGITKEQKINIIKEIKLHREILHDQTIQFTDRILEEVI